MNKKSFKDMDNPAIKFISPPEPQSAPPPPQGKRPRINLAFSHENLGFLQLISRVDGVSITDYVNRLVAADALARDGDVARARELFSK